VLLKSHLDVKQTDLWLFRNNVNYLLETTQDALENNPFYLLNGLVANASVCLWQIVCNKQQGREAISNLFKFNDWDFE
jgi:hypothetical protein